MFLFLGFFPSLGSQIYKHKIDIQHLSRKKSEKRLKKDCINAKTPVDTGILVT
jgi:hypothetical protein